MIKTNHILLLISVLGVVFFNYEIKKKYHQKEKEILKLNNLISEKKQNIKLQYEPDEIIKQTERTNEQWYIIIAKENK